MLSGPWALNKSLPKQPWILNGQIWCVWVGFLCVGQGFVVVGFFICLLLFSPACIYLPSYSLGPQSKHQQKPLCTRCWHISSEKRTTPYFQPLMLLKASLLWLPCKKNFWIFSDPPTSAIQKARRAHRMLAATQKPRHVHTPPPIMAATKATHNLLEDTCLSNSLDGEATLRVSTLE